jgi:hypothetical protein
LASSSSRAKAARAPAIGAPALVPLRVLAPWRDGTDYYAGTVTDRNASRNLIKFDDGHEGWVALENLRLLELRPGEPVCKQRLEHMYHVAERYEGQGDVQAVDASSKAHSIKSRQLLVLGLDIVRRFADRRVSRDELDARFPDTIDVFAGKVFIVTGSEEKKEVARKIQRNGGIVADDWTDIFDITDDGHTISCAGTPFLISVGTKRAVSSKLMSSLAAGVPVLSPRYVDDAINIKHGPVDWRAYLVSPGQSALLREPATQVVDPAWGSESWDAAEAQAVRQPLAGASVLWVPARISWKGSNEVNTLLPFCLRAMGASVTVAASLPSDLLAVEQEFVVVEDRDGSGPALTKAQLTSGKLVNVGWLKAVLMAGSRLPAGIIHNWTT